MFDYLNFAYSLKVDLTRVEPVLGLVCLYSFSIVPENDFNVFLCRFEMAIRAARTA